MKPILKFPKIIILGIISSSLILNINQISGDSAETEEGGETVSVVRVPYSPDYEPSSNSNDYYDPSEGVWPPEDFLSHRSARALYLAQGVEFVFPIGVQYTLANVNEQLWPIGTNGYEGVLEFPKQKIAIMFSSMINTLKIANFTVSSHIYTPEVKEPTTPLRILGTDMKTADFRAGYKDTWNTINADISKATGGSIPEFVPRGGLYGRTIYPFTTAAFMNSIHYQNQWAFPWKDGGVHKFTDTTHVPYMEVEGLMPYYENDAFVAVAALFKSGTGSVVFLKPKGAYTILQLMLNPTALTQIFDENFPGWGVKQMRVRVPQAAFTTNSQHFEMLIKRGVTNSFCVHETPQTGNDNRFSLNPIVQTNHIRLAKDTFTIASVTGVTLNNEQDLNQWNNRQRDDMAPETLLEEYTTPKEGLDDDVEMDTSTQLPINDGGIVIEEEVLSTTDASPATTEQTQAEGRSDLASISLANNSAEVEANSGESATSSSVPSPPAKKESNNKGPSVASQKKSPEVDVYDFDEPFLWFLHAINEEPMFMGVIESFKRYIEETGNKENVQRGQPSDTSAASGVIEKNGWIYEAAKGVLWHCPSMINKQAE